MTFECVMPQLEVAQIELGGVSYIAYVRDGHLESMPPDVFARLYRPVADSAAAPPVAPPVADDAASGAVQTEREFRPVAEPKARRRRELPPKLAGPPMEDSGQGSPPPALHPIHGILPRDYEHAVFLAISEDERTRAEVCTRVMAVFPLVAKSTLYRLITTGLEAGRYALRSQDAGLPNKLYIVGA